MYGSAIFRSVTSGERNAIEELLLLRGRGVRKICRKQFVRFTVEPHETAENLGLQAIVAVLLSTERYPVVEKFRNSGLRGASTAFIGGDDEVA